MKTLLLASCSLFVFLFSFGQDKAATIHGHFKANAPDSVTVWLPVNGNPGWASAEEIPVDRNGNFLIALQDSTLGYISIRSKERTIKMFLQKGDVLNLEIDSQSNKPVLFTGSCAAGQDLLSKDSLATLHFYEKDIFQADTSWQSFISHISNVKRRKIRLFQNLYEKRAINPAFLKFCERWANYLYATLISEQLWSIISAPNPPDSLLKVWARLYADLPPNDSRGLAIPTYAYYLNGYLTLYEEHRKKNAPDTVAFNQEKYLLSIRENINASLRGQVHEFATAFELLITYIQEEFEPVLPELFSDFKQRYPKSKYLMRLIPFNNEVLGYNRKIAGDFTKDQYFIQSADSIRSIAGLVKQFRGHYVFVDIWATWCGPCKNEFKYKDSLYSFLNTRDIRMLYMSIDFSDREAKWKDMIKYYDLNGYHIRASKSLSDYLRTDAEGIKLYSIPRYLLIDPQGRIVEPDALHPSDGQLLFAQIANRMAL